MPRNIIGASFDGYVQEQVSVRQQKLGLGFKDLDVIKFENTNAPFIRLTSGVDIEESIARDLGLPNPSLYAGNKLAKQFKLFSARTVVAGAEKFTSGIGYDTKSSYGFVSNSNAGYVPPPGITSIDVKALNRGSLREANIEIKCHNLEQFQILEILYMRLKYSILLEWGHSIYFNNNGELVQSYHDLSDEFLKGTSQQGMLDLIKDERDASNGNYDAFFGLVTNFTWSLLQDGSYQITVTARSVGDVIESLKINTNFPIPQSSKTAISGSVSTLQKNYYKTTIDRILWGITSQVYPGRGYAHGIDYNNEWALNKGANTQQTPIHNSNLEWMGDLKSIFNRDEKFDKQTNHLVWNEAWCFEFPNLNGGIENQYGHKNLQYYIKLGTLMRIIESFLLYYDTSKKVDYKASTKKKQTTSTQTPSFMLPTAPGKTGNAPGSKLTLNFVNSQTQNQTNFINQILNNSGLGTSTTQTHTGSPSSATSTVPPIFKIDYNYDENFCLTFPRHCSIDPRVCLIPIESQVSSSTPTTPYYIDTTYTLFVDEDGNFDSDYVKSARLQKYNDIDIWSDGVASTDPQILTNGLEEIKVIPDNNLFIYNSINEAFTDTNLSRQNAIQKLNAIKPFLSQTIYNFTTPIIPQYDTNYIIKASKLTNEQPFTGVVDRTTNTVLKNVSQLPPNANRTISTELVYRFRIVVRRYIDPGSTTAYIPSQLAPGSELYNALLKNTGFKTSGRPYIGNLMHMYVNMNYISSTLEKYYDLSTGEISLYDFLDNLMKGIQNALGNVNNFQITYDEDNNSYKIIDNTFIPGLEQHRQSYFSNGITKFNANILQNNYGSFVESVNFKTKLSNNFATMTTIGAQKNGNIVGSNSTALSKWNVGLEDRIIRNRTNVNGEIKPTDTIETLFARNITKLRDFNGLVNIYQVTDAEIDSFKNSIVDLFNSEVGEFTDKGKIPGIGFIPFDLELTMLGLSGPRIYESYTIDTTRLPKVYKDKIQFICSGISHKVDENGWKTTLNSICGPLYNNITISNPASVNNVATVVVKTAKNIVSTSGSFRDRLVAVAKQEEQYWRTQGWGRDAEATSSLARDRIVALGNVWGHSSVNLDYAPKKDGGGETQWSALTISSFIASADTGTTKANFSYRMKHSYYIEAGRKNQINNTGYYKSYSPDEVKANGSKIELGDLICWPHQKNTTVDTPGGYPGHCDVVVEITNNEAKVIGGNLSGTLKYGAPVTLDNTGNIIDNPTKRANWNVDNPYHAVIKWSVPN